MSSTTNGIIIMLSGYNDFEYAKATLEKGVFKYLLKPVDNDEADFKYISQFQSIVFSNVQTPYSRSVKYVAEW